MLIQGLFTVLPQSPLNFTPTNSGGARCSSMVRVFAHGAIGHQIDPSWRGCIGLFLVSASAPRLVNQRLWYVLSCAGKEWECGQAYFNNIL